MLACGAEPSSAASALGPGAVTSSFGELSNGYVRPLADIAHPSQGLEMKTLGLAVAAVLLGASTTAAGPSEDGCDVPMVKYIGDLQSILSRRAVEVVNRAARLQDGPDFRLQKLVEPSADFSLVAGDVGRPFGKGIAGARGLAKAMKADTYRFLNWNFIPTPVEDRCAAQKVEVEFTDTREKYVYPVTFMFRAGRVVAAEGLVPMRLVP